MDYSPAPLATLKNRKEEIYINKLPSRLGRNNGSVDIYYFHESISREHCLFECINHRFTVTDLDSTFGTFINGVRLEPQIPYNIENGARIRLGKVKFVFTADYHALSEWELAEIRNADKRDLEALDYIDLTPGPMNEIGGGMELTDYTEKPDVSIRELDDFEYDESEVIYIDCGLKPQQKSLKYTSEIRKKEIEDNIEDLEAEISEIDEPEAEVFEEEISDDMKQTIVLEKSELEAQGFGEDVADDADNVDEAADEDEEADADTNEHAAFGESTISFSCTDDASGDAENIEIDHFPFFFGRKSDVNDYAIANESVSRRHMSIEKTDEGFFVYDNASGNGVWLNGERIPAETMVRIGSGDRIRIPGVTIKVKID